MKAMKKEFLVLAVLVALMGSLVGCGGNGGNQPPPPPKPTVSISADPTTIIEGDSTKLTWQSSNASSCSASGDWSGAKSTSGSETVKPTSVGNKNYGMSCSGDGGSVSASVKVTVQALIVNVTPASATLVIRTSQQFVAKDQNGKALDVNWFVNGVQGGNSTVGTIDVSGLNTAPNFVPDPAQVTVTATSVSDPTKSASATVNVTMVVWSNIYNITAAGEVLHGAVAASDGSITAVGNDALATSHAVGISYDKNGNLLWAKTYNDSAFFATAINRGTETDLGGAFITSNPVIGIPLVVAVDVNGNITRTTPCPGNGSGHILASFQDSPNSGVFAGKLGDSVVIWQDVGGIVDCGNTATVHDLGNQGVRVLSIVSTADHYLVAGEYAGGILWNRSSYVVMADKSGNAIWRKNFPDVIAGIATERMEGANLSVYFTGRDLNEWKIFTVRLDQDGNIWPGWPVEWNGDNPASGIVVNYPSGIIPNPSAVGGIVIAGVSANPAGNVLDTVFISYKPDGSVYWKYRVHLSSATSQEQIGAAVVDSDGNIIVVGVANISSNTSSSLVAKITLPR